MYRSRWRACKFGESTSPSISKVELQGDAGEHITMMVVPPASHLHRLAGSDHDAGGRAGLSRIISSSPLESKQRTRRPEKEFGVNGTSRA